METHNKKSIAHTTARQQRGRRIDRDTVARVQQRAERLTEAVDNNKLNCIGAGFAERRRQHIEQQMAQLRSEAVKRGAWPNTAKACHGEQRNAHGIEQ